MFGLRKKGPIRPFTHADNCKILKGRIPPSDQVVGGRDWALAGGLPVRVRGRPRGARRSSCSARPLDAKTSRDAGECEFASDTDAAALKIVLKVKDGAGGSYHWVGCGSCGCAWQVPYYAGSVR